MQPRDDVVTTPESAARHSLPVPLTARLVEELRVRHDGQEQART